MPSPLQELIAPDSKSFLWIDHEGDLALGPFTFPEGIPLPVAGKENKLARLSWLQIPMDGRAPISAHESDLPEDNKLSGEEIYRAYKEGHLSEGSPDFLRLIDQVGRCLLIHAAFGEQREWHEAASEVFARVKKGPELFDLLVTRARARIQQGAYYTENSDGDAALFEYLIARLMMHGAHLISPATPGVLYDLGVLTHDLAHSLAFENEEENKFWVEGLSRESRDYLQLAMGDAEIRDNTPAYYLLGVNREVLNDIENATSAYEKFLGTKAAGLYPHVKEETEQRLAELKK